jgi:hypothetical protein
MLNTPPSTRVEPDPASIRNPTQDGSANVDLTRHGSGAGPILNPTIPFFLRAIRLAGSRKFGGAPSASARLTRAEDASGERHPPAVRLGGLLLQPRDLLPHEVAVDALALHQHLRRAVFAHLSGLQHDDAIEIAQAR